MHSVELKLLPVGNGDSIHLRFSDQDGIMRNILIDGGPVQAYEYLNSKKKKEEGALKELINVIREKNEHIDLLILTHIDDDHIGGILRWFEDGVNQNNLVKEVWFNSGLIVAEYFKTIDKGKALLIYPQSNFNTSIKQGITLEEKLEALGIWNKVVIKQSDVYQKWGAEFIILSPSETTLKLLLNKWEKEKINYNTASIPSDYGKSVQEHIASDIFYEDTSIPNGSSIAFLFQYKDIKILFMGDAYPTVVCNGLKQMGFSSEKRLKLDFLKVSHHGSKGNTSDELLNLIETKNFLISSDGSFFNLPDKQCIARILKHQQNSNFYFNYPQLTNSMFSEQDRKDFTISIYNASEYLKL